MKISNSMKETEATSNPKYGCEFCGRTFLRESTVLKHICEYKHRWLEKDRPGNRLAFQAWLQFYKKNSASKKQKTYEEFIKSAYYTAFAKFGSYCVDINALNVSRFADWLVKNQIKIDTWTTDTNYNKYLIEYLRTEDPLDAIHRSVETTIVLAQVETIQSKDYLRFGNSNRICHAITTGKISPWMLFHSKSGLELMDRLDPTQIKMIFDYIDPEKWALKFHREPENVRTVKEILNAGGY
jgi:hypothetical protein